MGWATQQAREGDERHVLAAALLGGSVTSVLSTSFMGAALNQLCRHTTWSSLMFFALRIQMLEVQGSTSHSDASTSTQHYGTRDA